jgi:phospholipid transport system transporter-binding protein
LAFVLPVHTVQVTQAAPDRLTLTGALTFHTARSAYETGLHALQAGQPNTPWQVDCSGVTESDSAGLAVLIEWLAAAVRLGRTLRFVNLPDGIRAAAQISEVEGLLESGA